MKKRVLPFIFLLSIAHYCLLFGQTLPQNRFQTIVTYVQSEGNGRIAVKLKEPASPRYSTGTGIVLSVGANFTSGGASGFTFDLPIDREGIVAASLLWPGCNSRLDNAESDGTFDYGGPSCVQALSDVVLFLAGKKTDVNGKTVQQLLSTPVDVNDIGLYAFSHPGIAVVQLFAHHPESAKYISFFVGGENPTTPEIIASEVGHYVQKKPSNIPVYNPFYNYPGDYSQNGLIFDYTHIRYQPETGTPYYDVDKNRTFSTGDISFAPRRETFFSKIVYSVNLLNGLLANGSLQRTSWPKNWATPEEAESWWESRSMAFQFERIANHHYQAKVLLVFAEEDHVQTAKDKPHIHQMYDGFLHIAKLPWVRLNPDRSYLETAEKKKNSLYNEHPANIEPADWLQIEEWAIKPPLLITIGTLAAVIEMVDRVHFDQWASDLNRTLK